MDLVAWNYCSFVIFAILIHNVLGYPRKRIPYTSGMLVWKRITDQLWWPGVINEPDCVIKSGRDYRELLATVYCNNILQYVSNHDYIKPYDCADKKDFILSGKRVLKSLDEQCSMYQYKNFKRSVRSFDEVQRLNDDTQLWSNNDHFHPGHHVWIRLNETPAVYDLWWPGVVVFGQTVISGTRIRAIVLFNHKLFYAHSLESRIINEPDSNVKEILYQRGSVYLKELERNNRAVGLLTTKYYSRAVAAFSKAFEVTRS